MKEILPEEKAQEVLKEFSEYFNEEKAKIAALICVRYIRNDCHIEYDRAYWNNVLISLSHL